MNIHKTNKFIFKFLPEYVGPRILENTTSRLIPIECLVHLNGHFRYGVKHGLNSTRNTVYCHLHRLLINIYNNILLYKSELIQYGKVFHKHAQHFSQAESES